MTLPTTMLARSSGLVDPIFVQWPIEKKETTNTSALAPSKCFETSAMGIPSMLVRHKAGAVSPLLCNVYLYRRYRGRPSEMACSSAMRMIL